jgi:hypothetical protein
LLLWMLVLLLLLVMYGTACCATFCTTMAIQCI